MKKIKVVVLMGGRSSEHEIALATGREVVKFLDREKYEVLPVVIPQKSLSWQLDASLKPDVVFLALHGPYGEDGTLQGMLELMGLPYTGSGVLASALGMEKVMFRKVMEREKIRVPRWLTLGKQDSTSCVEKFFGQSPLCVKPTNQGSSVGVSLVRRVEQLPAALNLAFTYSDPVLVEEFLEGLEVSCGVLGNKNPSALPIAEILPKNEFFDYEAKYTPGKSKEIVPARLSKALTEKVQKMAVRVFEAIGAKGFARVDMILKNEGPFVLEINTLPGLTPTSILPKEAAAAGISYSLLLNRMIELALQR